MLTTRDAESTRACCDIFLSGIPFAGPILLQKILHRLYELRGFRDERILAAMFKHHEFGLRCAPFELS
jgi:hypothetical protein